MKKKNIIITGIVTVMILLIPLIAMQFTNEVNWTLFDFAVMGTLLFGTGMVYEFISSRSGNVIYKTAVAIAVGAGLLLIWINLAVGMIGSERNPVNILYAGVLFIGVGGALISRFRPNVMANTLFLMAFVQLLVPVAALIFCPSTMNEPPDTIGIFGLNGFFALLFSISALLFKRAGDNYNESTEPKTLTQ